MSYYYSQREPKWNKADKVQAANAEGMHVHVTIWLGTEHERTFQNCLVENHNMFGLNDRSDVTVEDTNPSFGWRRIWFMNRDIEPYQE